MAQAVLQWVVMRFHVERLISHSAGLIAIFGLASTIACTVEVPVIGGGGGGSDAALRAEFAVNVLPLLEQSCGTCHAAGSAAAYDGVRFMEPVDGDVYDAVFGWDGVAPLINESDPVASPLVTKGAHTGPAWTIEQLDTIRPWLENVDEFLNGGGPSLFTNPITPTNGINNYDFADIGIPQLAGSQLEINFDLNSGLLYLLKIEVIAGTSALSLDTLDVGVIAGGDPLARFDSNNKFNGIVTEIPAGGRDCLGACSLIASWIPPEELSGSVQLVFGFNAINAGSGGGGVMCNDPDFLYANVLPEFVNLGCPTCHGANQTTSTPYLDGLDAPAGDTAARAAQCRKILLRSNYADTAQEHDIITQVNAPGHPVDAVVTLLDTQLDSFVANEGQ